MRTDPRIACANERQRLLWAIAHDALAHPLMVLTAYCGLSLRFHDWTSHKAWPRKEKQWRWPVVSTDEKETVESYANRLRLQGVPFVLTAQPGYSGPCGVTIHYRYTLERLTDV